MAVFTIERTVQAPLEHVWRFVSNLNAYGDVAPNLSKAVVTSGTGEGMTRRCWDHQNQHWDETCTLWEPFQQYRFVVDTSAPNYPYPFKALAGTWQIEKVAATITAIRMLFDYTLKYGVVGKLANELILKRQFQKICEQLLDNWETLILKTPVA